MPKPSSINPATLERLRKKRENKYGANSDKNPLRTPEDFQREALQRFKNSIMNGLVDKIGIASGLVDIAIKDYTSTLFFELGVLMESLSDQVLDESTTVLRFNTLKDKWVLFAKTEEDKQTVSNLPDQYEVQKKDLGPFFPFIVFFFETHVSTFLNVFHEYY